MNDFSAIAPIYDQLARLVFRGAIERSQTQFLCELKKGWQLLLLGGGTGLVLEHLDLQKTAMSIDFVEPSGKMMKKAKVRLSNSSKLDVVYHECNFEDIEISHQYDAIHCGYFLDLFSEVNLVGVIQQIKKMLKPSGILLIADFQLTHADHQFWQKPMIDLMHWFFRIFSNLESDQLRDFDSYLTKEGFVVEYEQEYFSKMVFSRVYSLG